MIVFLCLGDFEQVGGCLTEGNFLTMKCSTWRPKNWEWPDSFTLHHQIGRRDSHSMCGLKRWKDCESLAGFALVIAQSPSSSPVEIRFLFLWNHQPPALCRDLPRFLIVIRSSPSPKIQHPGYIYILNNWLAIYIQLYTLYIYNIYIQYIKQYIYIYAIYNNI